MSNIFIFSYIISNILKPTLTQISIKSSLGKLLMNNKYKINILEHDGVYEFKNKMEITLSLPKITSAVFWQTCKWL